MQTIKTIGLDIAKSVFQVHGIDAAPPLYDDASDRRMGPARLTVPP